MLQTPTFSVVSNRPRVFDGSSIAVNCNLRSQIAIDQNLFVLLLNSIHMTIFRVYYSFQDYILNIEFVNFQLSFHHLLTTE